MPRALHAISRLQQLFAGAFSYPLKNQTSPQYQIREELFPTLSPQTKTILLFPSTTWDSKHLPNNTWKAIASAACADGYHVKISWGTKTEQARADWIATGLAGVEVLPKSSLNELAIELRSSSGAIAVDTGLGHMAAALGVPTVSIYGSTDASLTGAIGESQTHLQSEYHCSPCFQKHCNKLTNEIKDPPCYQIFSASAIWQSLHKQIS